MEQFWSPGKLMLSGEYVVLKGAKALGLPTVLGQMLEYDHNASRKIHFVNFISKMPGRITWYKNQFLIDEDFEPSEQKNNERTEFIRSLLIGINQLNPEFFKAPGCHHIRTFMEFDPGWGLGSSASLISNLAMLTDVQPFDLLFTSSLNQGSGYDVATSFMGTPLLYNIEEEVFHWAEPVELKWKKFVSKCRLIYLNRKQDSNREVKTFKSKWKDGVSHDVIREITEISEKLPEVKEYEKFKKLLVAHEEIISEIIKQKPIKDNLFPDFNGVIKSLGSWGGDFILACSDSTPEYTEKYFLDQGYQVVIDFSKLIDYKWK